MEQGGEGPMANGHAPGFGPLPLVVRADYPRRIHMRHEELVGYFPDYIVRALEEDRDRVLEQRDLRTHDRDLALLQRDIARQERDDLLVAVEAQATAIQEHQETIAGLVGLVQTQHEEDQAQAQSLAATVLDQDAMIATLQGRIRQMGDEMRQTEIRQRELLQREFDMVAQFFREELLMIGTAARGVATHISSTMVRGRERVDEAMRRIRRALLGERPSGTVTDDGAGTSGVPAESDRSAEEDPEEDPPEDEAGTSGVPARSDGSAEEDPEEDPPEDEAIAPDDGTGSQ